jgi:hypothetical protein
MNAAHYPFGKLHYLSRKADYTRWHRLESKRHILRSQLGFVGLSASRPKPCIGCQHYHGIAYGYTQETRMPLICGFHPYGWQSEGPCPDWQGAT